MPKALAELLAKFLWKNVCRSTVGNLLTPLHSSAARLGEVKVWRTSHDVVHSHTQLASNLARGNVRGASPSRRRTFTSVTTLHVHVLPERVASGSALEFRNFQEISGNLNFCEKILILGVFGRYIYSVCFWVRSNKLKG